MTGGVEHELRNSYSDAAASWAAGPSRVYGLLADALIACIPAAVSGAVVLDLGGGTGVASDTLQRAGARVIAADAAAGMLQHRASERPPAVCADAGALPFRAASFDAVVGAFVLNHVPDLIGALAEARRVTRAPGAIVASTFSTERHHPAKDAISTVVDAAGYVAPEWFGTFKTQREPTSGSVEALSKAATSAGLVENDAFDVDVDISAVGAEGLADYRLGMAHMQPFIDALDEARRAEVRAEAIAAAAPFLAVPMPMLVLVARVQG